MVKRLSLLFGSFSILYGNSNALDYLNSLRQQANLPTLTTQENLSKAALNHSKYMALNHVAGHSEKRGNPGFSGETPQERALYAGYLSKIVSENVSWGSPTYQESIDSLMSAIYHRFTFLTYSKDEIGVAKEDRFYTYDLGNSKLNELCKKESTFKSGTYYKICKDTNKKISIKDYQKGVDSIKSSAPETILWPPKKGTNIPPVFFEEHPDPLPYYSVSGYPISVEFNDYFYKNPPSIDSFEIKDSKGNILDTITLMDKNSDPNEKFNEFQFALFPTKRLEWGSAYYVNLNYSDNSGEHQKQWCFQTRVLKSDRFYRVENAKNTTLKVIPNKSYTIYVVPRSKTDELGQISFDSRVDLKLIDKNTLEVKTKANIGDRLKIKADNGQIIYLEVSKSDNASLPKNEKCEDKEFSSKNSSKKENIKSKKGEVKVEIKSPNIEIEKINEKKIELKMAKEVIVEAKDSSLEIKTYKEPILKEIPINNTKLNVPQKDTIEVSFDLDNSYKEWRYK